MRFIDSLCPPALLYVLFVAIQVALDVSMGMFVTAAVKICFGIIGTIVLDSLCGVQLSVVSWALVATPFIVTSLATAISMGLDADHRIVSGVREHFVEGAENPPPKKSKVLGKVVMAKPDGTDGDAIMLSMLS